MIQFIELIYLIMIISFRLSECVLNRRLFLILIIIFAAEIILINTFFLSTLYMFYKRKSFSFMTLIRRRNHRLIIFKCVILTRLSSSALL